jgi:hypothetical protein
MTKHKSDDYKIKLTNYDIYRIESLEKRLFIFNNNFY